MQGENFKPTISQSYTCVSSLTSVAISRKPTGKGGGGTNATGKTG